MTDVSKTVRHDKRLTRDASNGIFCFTVFQGLGLSLQHAVLRDRKDLHCRHEGIAIYRNDYANNYALYSFDLTADLGDEENFSLMRQGSVRLVLKFGQALATTVTVVVYTEFENVIEIDRNRNVINDIGA